MEGMEDLNHAHYFPMQSQGNINSICYLKLINGSYKILVASLKRQVFCFDYLTKPDGTLNPSTKDISFTYIPASSEILSIDAFNKSSVKNDFVIGITIVKTVKDGLETYLNIYSECEDNGEFNVESIAQNCFNIQLSFVPHYHGHTEHVRWKETIHGSKIAKKESVFILAGGDKEVHMFKEDPILHTYQEVYPLEYFPEFYTVPEIITWIEIKYFDDYAFRLTAIGTETGYLRISKVCVKTKTTLFNHTNDFVSYISHINIYEETYPAAKPAFVSDLNDQVDSNAEGAGDKSTTMINIIVTNTSIPSVIFLDCGNTGMDKYKTLKRIEFVSVTSCVEVADLDFDGEQEILLGNSRQEILLYKRNHELDAWKIFEVKYVVSPIFRMKYLDLTGDGVNELVVFTLKGLYIFQHDAEHLQKKLEENLKNLSLEGPIPFVRTSIPEDV